MIDITKPVRRKCGDHVEIISDKGKPPYLLIGYVGRGTWDIESWRLDGRHSEDGSSPSDLENYEPEPKPEEWAAEKAALAAGKVIQFYAKGLGGWQDINGNPLWAKGTQYRIKPEPQWVELGPDDIVAGMEFTNDTGTRYQWTEVDTYGVTLVDSSVSFEQLLRLGYEYRINGGDWKPCKKEVLL